MEGNNWSICWSVLRSFNNLEDNYDGEGARKPKDSVAGAIRLLGIIESAGWELPHIAPIPDGTIQFEWHKPNYLEANIVGDEVEWMEELKEGMYRHWSTTTRLQRLPDKVKEGQ